MSRKTLWTLAATVVGVSTHGRCPPLQVVNPLCCGGGSEVDGIMGDKIYREGRFSRTMTLALRRLETLEKRIQHLRSQGGPSAESEDSVVSGDDDDMMVDAESGVDEESFDIDV